MKAFVVTTLFAAILSTNLMAAADKTCYPFGNNQDGFNRVCVAIENTSIKDTDVAIELYRYEKLVKSVVGQRVYNPQQRVCTSTPSNPNFCYRRYEGLQIIFEDQDLNVELHMRVNRSTTCLNGDVAIREQLRIVKLDIECPNLSWGNSEI